MSRKETGSHFKRILSHTSPNGGGNPVLQRQTNFHNTKKIAKLRTAVPDQDHGRQGNTYKLRPEYEPLLSRQLSTSPDEIPRYNSSVQRITTQNNFTYGHFAQLDFRQDSPRGIMSVTDINLTMGDDDHPPVSSMKDSISYTSTSSKQGSQSLPLARCSKVTCNENSCLWHRCVLKLPQHVRWEDRIVTIELERNNDESFGFDYKSKQHIGKDEMYTLVSHIDKDSTAARSGLALGDLILSANNIPMQTKQEFSKINFITQNKLRLLVQHPLEISSKAANHVKQLKASMGIIHEITNPPIHLPQPLTPPSTSPTDPVLSPYKDNIPLYKFPKPEVKKGYHQLPQVRIFVCGNATKEFIHSLIGDSISVLHDDRAQCFEISMQKNLDGTVSIGNSLSFSYIFQDSSEACINVQLISVSDYRFFHHCCSWMFTENSVFILTFDTKRLSLSSEVEMSHLCSLAHTIRTSVPKAYENIRLYGIASADGNICLEEVQTLFYTSHGKSLPDPRIIPLAKGVICEEMRRIQLDIFNMLMNISEQQEVIDPTSIALDMLVSHRELTTTLSELTKTLEERNSDSKQLSLEAMYRVIEDLRNTGNLLVTGSGNAACVSESVKEFVLPCVLFDQLSCLAECAEKDYMRWPDLLTALSSCGIVTRMEFLDFLSTCTSDPEKVLNCMEDFRLVFPVKVMSQDSGFGDVSSILFPYYLQDIPVSACHADSYQIYMAVEFSGDVPSSSFFSLLSELSQIDNCQSFTMRSLFTGHMILQGEDLCLYFMKTNQQILIFKNRSARPGRSVGKKAVFQLIQQMVIQQIPSSVKVKVKLYPQEPVVVDTTDERNPPLSHDNDSHPGGVADLKHEEDDTVRKYTQINYEEKESSLPNTPVGAAALLHKGLQIDIPSQLNTETGNNGAALMLGDDVEHELSDQERAMQRVLDIDMQELKYIHGELNAIYRYLSVPGTLQLFASECDLKMFEYELYEVMTRQNHTKLPAQVFIEMYFREHRITLRDFMQILFKVTEQGHDHLLKMVQNLWSTAFYKNSNYAENFYQNPSC